MTKMVGRNVIGSPFYAVKVLLVKKHISVYLLFSIINLFNKFFFPDMNVLMKYTEVLWFPRFSVYVNISNHEAKKKQHVRQPF